MALSATPKVAELVIDTCIPYREAIKPAGLLQPGAPFQALLLEQAVVLKAWDARQEEQTDGLKHLLSELLRKTPEQVDLARTDSLTHRRGSEDGVSCGASSSEVSTAPDSTPSVSMCQQHADNQQAQLPYRASSAPMDMMPGMPGHLPGLPGLRMGRLIGRGSFGRVYRGSWEGRPMAVKVMCHEGGAADRLSALHEALVAQQVKHKNVIATYRVHTLERPAGQEEWCLYRSASLGQTLRQWPQSGQPVVPFLPSEGCSVGQGYSLRAGSCLRAASQKTEGAGAAARSGNATSLAAAVSAAADGALTLGKTCDAALMSPFNDVIEKVASGCREAAAQPLTRIARHMSLDPAGCNRDFVKNEWRSLSFGDPVRKRADIVGCQVADEEQPEACSMPTCLESCEDSKEADMFVETFLLMELAELGSLDKYMVHARLKHNRVALIECLIDIAAGMGYLHSASLLHGDLKTANVLLKSCAPSPGNSRGFTCKIADFGLSRVICDGATHVSTNSHGTVAYVAPEVLQRGVMAMPADVYSYSMLMLELWNGELVYRGINTHQVLFQVFGGQKPDVPGDMPAEYCALMQDCWATDPAARPTFRDILPRLRHMLADARAAAAEATPSN